MVSSTTYMRVRRQTTVTAPGHALPNRGDALNSIPHANLFIDRYVERAYADRRPAHLVPA